MRHKQSASLLKDSYRSVYLSKIKHCLNLRT